MTLIRAEQAARQAEQAAWRGATWRGTSGSVLGQVAWRVRQCGRDKRSDMRIEQHGGAFVQQTPEVCVPSFYILTLPF